MEIVRLLIADDHDVVREGLRALFSHHQDIRLVGEAANGEQALALYGKLRPDVAIVDLRLPRVSGLDVISGMRRIDPRGRIVVLTSFEGDATARDALARGAAGFLFKGTPGSEVLACIRRVASGHHSIGVDVRTLLGGVADPDLTAREVEVLTLVTQGLRNQQISQKLGIAESTVKVHVQAIMGKLHARDRTEAAVIALKRGLVPFG